MTGDGAPAPGWYPDPERRAQVRFWDGTSWAPSEPAPSLEQHLRAVWPILLAVAVVGSLGGVRWLTLRSANSDAGPVQTTYPVVTLNDGPTTTRPLPTVPIATADPRTTTTTPNTASTIVPTTTTTTPGITTTTDPFATTLPIPASQENGGDGSGQFPIVRPDGPLLPLILEVEHTGNDNFVVRTDTRTIVSTRGGYDDVVIVSDPEDINIFVEATGPWRIIARSARTLPTFDNKTFGTTRSVVYYNGTRGQAMVKYDGEASFIVRLYAADGVVTQPIDTAGELEQKIDLNDTPVVIEIIAHGSWSIDGPVPG